MTTALPLSPFITDREAYITEMACKAVEDALVKGLARMPRKHLAQDLRPDEPQAEELPAFLAAPSPDYLAATQKPVFLPIVEVLHAHATR